MDEFDRDLEFEWDKGNLDKNWKKHGIINKETEEIFQDNSLLVGHDFKHSTVEIRYLLYGRTKKGKYLTVVFTRRSGRIRIISARLMNKKERNKYDQEKI